MSDVRVSENPRVLCEECLGLLERRDTSPRVAGGVSRTNAAVCAWRHAGRRLLVERDLDVVMT